MPSISWHDWWGCLSKLMFFNNEFFSLISQYVRIRSEMLPSVNRSMAAWVEQIWSIFGCYSLSDFNWIINRWAKIYSWIILFDNRRQTWRRVLCLDKHWSEKWRLSRKTNSYFEHPLSNGRIILGWWSKARFSSSQNMTIKRRTENSSMI